MDTYLESKTLVDMPYMIAVDNRVEEVNELFLNLTGYEEKSILGRKVEEVWQQLLRINIEHDNIKQSNECDCFMFDIKRTVKEVTIIYSKTPESNQSIYTFQQKKNSLFDEKFSFLELANSANDTGLALYSIPDFILLKANKDYFKYFSEGHKNLEDILGLPLEVLIPSWKNSKIYDAYINVVNSGKSAFFNEQLMKFTEISSFYARYTLTPVFEEGRVKYLVQIHNDVTEKVMNREAVDEKNRIIEEQKNRLETILETVSKSVALCIVDKDGYFVGDNSMVDNYFKPFENINNVKETYMPGMYFDESGNELLPEDLPISRVLMGEKVSQYRLTMKFDDGIKHYVVNGTPILDSQSNVLMGLICAWEITERIKYQQFIETQRDYLYKLFNSLDLPILYLTYPDLKIIELNKKAVSVLKVFTGPEDEIIKSHFKGRNVSEIAPSIKDYSESAFLEQMKRTKSTICHEKLEVKKNDHRIYYNVTYQPILNIGGEVSELLVVAVDVTDEVEERKQMEDVLKLKDEFLYLMSHEFKTPLTVINAAVQSLEYIYSSQIPDKAIVLIEKIKQNTFRQIRLVNNLLDITRINAGQIKIKKRNIDIVFLTREITESVAIYAEQKGIEVVFASKLQQRVIGIDDEKFERIMLNLLSNAIKFTPEGKKIVVEVSAKLNKKKRMICIKVKDQGIGIPKAKHNLIFERFGQVDSTLTRQAEGTGIGLFLVKLMVNACKGEIHLESEEGKGSVFTLMIPSNKAKVNIGEQEIKHISDSRLVRSLETEFSDIYF